MFGHVKSEDRRRCFAVAARAGRGGRRWEAEEGVRIGVRKVAWGGGRFWTRRAEIRSASVGVAMFSSRVGG